MNNIRRLILAPVIMLLARTAFAVEPLEEIVEQKYDVNPAATLSVENIDGSIRVYAADKPEIVIQAIKKAYNPERLQGIVVDVKASQSGVAITTTFPPRKNALSDRSGTVDYIIVVPQAARIADLKLTNGEIFVEGLRNGGKAKAHLVNGWLAGHNCFGDLDLTVETGRLDVVYDWWENHESAIKAASTRGNIRAIFPSDASFNLSATATEGRIANRFQSTTTTSKDVVHSVAEVIGSEAQTLVSLDARRGNIRIDKIY
jgi:Putative adhesin